MTPSDTESTSSPPHQTTIHTDGGPAVMGDVHTGGDFVGRDQTIQGDTITATIGDGTQNVAVGKEITQHINQTIIQVTDPSQVPSLLTALLPPNKPTKRFEPTLIRIPAGEFWMGSDDGPTNERPRHRVSLPAYQISKYPISNGQYAEFLKRNPQVAQPDLQHWFQRRPKKGLDHFPVVNLSWHDAMTYCRWLQQETGRAYTLPSEAQWERAARGNDGRLYPWGDEWQAGCANFGGAQIMAVDAHPAGASPEGTLDLLGNVEEWTSTLWGSDQRTSDFPYPYRAEDGRDDTTVTQFRIHRGGSYRHAPQTVRATTRSAIHQDTKVPWLGFRVIVNA